MVVSECSLTHVEPACYRDHLEQQTRVLIRLLKKLVDVIAMVQDLSEEKEFSESSVVAEEATLAEDVVGEPMIFREVLVVVVEEALLWLPQLATPRRR